MRISSTPFRIFNTLLLLLFVSVSAWAQTQSPLDIALRHLEEKQVEWKLTSADISDMVITDNYVSKNSGARMLYMIQRYQGVKVYNAMYNVAITEEGKVAHAGNRIIDNIALKANTTQPSKTAVQAVEAALQHLNINQSGALQQIERRSNQEFVFDKSEYSRENITARLHLFPTRNQNQEVRLAWDVFIHTVAKKDNAWNLQVDAVTGEIIEKRDRIIRCTFDAEPAHIHSANCGTIENVNTNFAKNEVSVAEALAAPVLLGGSYNVYGEINADGFLQAHESPSHGDRNMLVDIEDPTASPHGWHDTDGVDGPEYTFTRGNNIHAYLDKLDQNGSQNDEPDGGMSLLFDFPIDNTNEPETFEPAATTNAFFMGNFIHDFSYAHGFDEASGNFQTNNYGNGGNGGDHVIVEVSDGSGTNNANFSTPNDGGSGRMQMFLWNSGSVGLLTVESPSQIAGVFDVSHPTDWGGAITGEALTAEVAVVNDGTINGSQGCGDLVNGADLMGKIALIDRGTCEFGRKVVNAENAGAVGAIICNFEEGAPGMAAGAVGGQATIPVVSMGLNDCTTLRGFIGDGLMISFVEPTSSGPEFLTASVDNGVIAHEYGHGISNRLIGGPNNTSCMNNGEQMGEGISDFITLVTTVKPTDVGEMRRGIGTFVTREATDGRGIRRFPYSTDMTINPLTYDDITGFDPATAPHPIGEVMSLMLWEMYWGLVEVHGFDSDITNGDGGNNIAVKLVMEGMKLAGCSPGYVDIREGILAADAIMYGGANQVTIWTAFAKRGLGDSADQGSSFDNNDGVSNFDLPIEFLDEVRITKSVTELIAAGDNIDVTIEVNNYKQSGVANNVVVTDEIPAGTTVIASSVSNGGVVSGNVISFDLGNMTALQTIEITYQLETDPNIVSTASFYDDMEDYDLSTESNFDINFDLVVGNNAWDIRDDSLANSGTNAYFVRDVANESRQNFYKQAPFTVTGDQPVLRFYQWYDTEAGADGGLFEISKDGLLWEQVGDDFFREGYPGSLQYATFVIPFLNAFSGQSVIEGGAFKATYLDLSPYMGEEITFRFRFGTDDNTSGIGWFVDDIAVMDMKNYVGQACVTTEEGDNECSDVSRRGTVVDFEGVETVSVDNPFDTNMAVNLFPNPAGDILNVQIQNDKNEDGTIQILSVDGKEMMNRPVRISDGMETLNLNVANLAAGMYFVKVGTAESIVIEKLTIK